MTTPDDPGQPGQPQYPPPGGQPPQYPSPGGQPPQYPPPGGQPPQYPPPGGPQYPPAGGPPPQYPPVGGPPQQYPPAGGPVPPQFAPPGGPGGVPAYAAGGVGAYGAPLPKKSRKKLLFIALGVIAVLIIAIVVLAVVFTKGTITSIDDAKAGDCITISGTKTDATPKKASCDAQSFNFVVAEQLNTDTDSCGGEQYSELTQKGKGKLCLVPNLRVDKCYEFPDNGGAITDFKDYECGKTAESSGREVVKVTDRVDSTDVTSCPEGAAAITFDKPKPLGYCLELQTTQ